MRSIVPPYGRWEPATPAQVASLFSAMPCRWWVAGGYTIELALGQRVRDHDDIDVMMMRPDQLHLRGCLHGGAGPGQRAGGLRRRLRTVMGPWSYPAEISR